MLFFLAYNLFVSLMFVLLFPYFLYEAIFKKAGFFERLGFVRGLSEPVLWFHSASVGEITSISALVKEFKREMPHTKILVTVMTKTGKERAKQINPPPDFVFYLPFDIPLFVLNFVRKIKPIALLLVESEMWVNLIYFTRMRTKHIILINGRFSERTFRRAYPFRRFLRWFFDKFEFFLLRTDADKQRLMLMGVDKNKAEVLGELKFSINYMDYACENINKPQGAKLIVAGCTHSGEDEILLEIFERLRMNHPELKLVLAPRHPERFASVRDFLTKSGTKFSSYSKDGANFENPIILLDKMGKLISFYSVADIAFVGGSLVDVGGHNPLEPAYFGVPVLAGPHIQNAEEQFKLLASCGSAFIVKDKFELEQRLSFLLDNEELRKSAGEKAREIVRAQADTVIRYFKRLKEIIDENPV